jgi:predicted membrane-bound spermidine synthase
MGTSLPFLTRATVRSGAGAGRTIGRLYAVNTLGAALGALAAPWLLMRFLGLTGATLVAAAANVTAALLAVALALTRGPDHAGDVEAAAPARAAAPAIAPPPFAAWTALYAASGFVALSLEILWFRVVDVAVKPNAFTFGTVLCLYLLGLGAGAIAGGALLPRVRDPLAAFLGCQCALLLYAGAAIGLLTWISPRAPLYAWYFEYFRAWKGFPLGQAWDPAAVFRLYVLLPAFLYGVPTLLMGLSFPILQRAVQGEARTSGLKVGALQAANIAGCVAGSLLVGLVGLSWLGTVATLRALLVIGIAFALVGALRTARRARFVAAGLALGLLAAVLPGHDSLWRRLHGVTTERAFIEEDATGVPVIRRLERGWHVSVNGVPHSSLPYGGLHTVLGALPALVHAEPRDVAVIGLGSGDTAWAAGLRPETRRLRVFEICGPQLALLRRLAESRAAPVDELRRLLADPRLDVVVADGRHALERGRERWDVIQMDPLHADSAYSGLLYSEEFYRRALRHLRPGGILCTWLPSARTYTTFAAAAPYVVEFGGNMLLGANEPIPFEPDRWRDRLHRPEVLAYLGPAAAGEVAARLGQARPGDPPAPGRILPNTDLFPRDELARDWRDRP